MKPKRTSTIRSCPVDENTLGLNLSTKVHYSNKASINEEPSPLILLQNNKKFPLSANNRKQIFFNRLCKTNSEIDKIDS